MMNEMPFIHFSKQCIIGIISKCFKGVDQQLVYMVIQLTPPNRKTLQVVMSVN